jgi:hypothetical protein
MQRYGLELVHRLTFVWFAEILVNGVAALAVGLVLYLGQMMDPTAAWRFWWTWPVLDLKSATGMAKTTKSELRANLLKLAEACPFHIANPEDCPLFPLRKMTRRKRLSYVNALSEGDLAYPTLNTVRNRRPELLIEAKSSLSQFIRFQCVSQFFQGLSHVRQRFSRFALQIPFKYRSTPAGSTSLDSVTACTPWSVFTAGKAHPRCSARNYFPRTYSRTFLSAFGVGLNLPNR